MGTYARKTGARAGTQSIERALSILKEISSANATGCTIQTLIEKLDLNRTTVYRLTKCLEAQGAVRQDARSKKFFLGPLALALGVAAQHQLDLKQMFAPSARRLAEATGDTCFVMLRSGTDAVCIDRCLGSFPIKTLTVEVGTKRPLGIGAGSLAILAAMRETEIDDLMRANDKALPGYGQSSASIAKAVRMTQKVGYVAAPVHGLEQVIAIGLPILDRADNPIAALSIAAIAERMSAKRRVELLTLLRMETDHLHEALFKANILAG